jgi:two-component system sensor histidine kinase BarA
MTANTNNNDLIIDWELGVRLAGNRQDLARETFNWLKNNLPQDMGQIKQAQQSNNYPELLQQLHKLHGALCYCGVPRLKKVVASFEKSIKNNHIHKIDTFMTDLEFEINQVLEKVSQIGE